ncbi:hypothetical protein E2493_20005 [Sphingomonas parva]|uniref:Uncharacterized protein n=1 Tax=Sphingomonas parva TaxID=2555898 RepID=A0A4Y8ZKI1_9SPHN|nr:hypothetical protein [Sphingomonas parva]TFI56488.1 hypothetical protein E2493_20005 [Sphingomonas parva]
MAKDGKKKTKIPKQVAGIKVPKKLRKAGNKAVKLAQDPIVGEVVAAALLSAAAALREGGGAKDGAGAAAKGAEDARQQAGRLGDSLKVLAIDLARRTLEGLDDGHKARTREKAKPGTPEPAGD